MANKISPDGNSPIGESISKCKENIRTILYRLKAFYEPCDLDTARGFSENLIKGFNKVFDDFITNIQQNNSSIEISSNETVANGQELFQIVLSDSEDEPEPVTEYKNIKFGGKTRKSCGRRRSKKSLGKIECEVCRNMFKYTQLLVFHRRIHLDDFPIYCRICLHTYSNEKQRNRHENDCKQLRYECYVCRNLAADRSNLKRHMRTHSGTKPFACKYCSKRYKCKDSLNRHQKESHAKSRHDVDST